MIEASFPRRKVECRQFVEKKIIKFYIDLRDSHFDDALQLDTLMIYIKEDPKFYWIIIRNSIIEHKAIIFLKSNNYFLTKMQFILEEINYEIFDMYRSLNSQGGYKIDMNTDFGVGSLENKLENL